MHSKEDPIPVDLVSCKEAALQADRPYSTVKKWAQAGLVRRYFKTTINTKGSSVRQYVSLSEVLSVSAAQPVRRRKHPAAALPAPSVEQVQLLPDPAPANVLPLPDPALRTLALTRVADLTGALTILRRQCPDAVTADMVAHLADDLAWLQGKL